MVKRQRSDRSQPLERLTYPLNSKGRREKVPREKWTPLRLKIWRHQMAAGVRFRSEVWQLVNLGVITRVRDVQSWVRPSNYRLLAAQALRRRFGVGDPWDGTAPSSRQFLISIDQDPTLTPSWERRLAHVVKRRIAEFASGISNVVQVVSGRKCALCSEDHGTHRCYSLLAQSLRQTRDHRRLALDRIADPATTPSDRMDDVARVSSLDHEEEKMLLKRVAGMEFWVQGAMIGRIPDFIRKIVGFLRFGVDLVEDVSYVLTGASLMSAVFGAQRLTRLAVPSLRSALTAASVRVRTPTPMPGGFESPSWQQAYEDSKIPRAVAVTETSTWRADLREMDSRRIALIQSWVSLARPPMWGTSERHRQNAFLRLEILDSKVHLSMDLREQLEEALHSDFALGELSTALQEWVEDVDNLTRVIWGQEYYDDGSVVPRVQTNVFRAGFNAR